jgi:hypothetical protein
LITVIGISTKPADVRAIAPVVRFAKFDSFGSADEVEGCTFEPSTTPMFRSRVERATCCRRALRLVK